ncbi:hypothetical protein T310_6234, partial [Rasamsonia emersonii CBS 393.64]
LSRYHLRHRGIVVGSGVERSTDCPRNPVHSDRSMASPSFLRLLFDSSSRGFGSSGFSSRSINSSSVLCPLGSLSPCCRLTVDPIQSVQFLASPSRWSPRRWHAVEVCSCKGVCVDCQ